MLKKISLIIFFVFLILFNCNIVFGKDKTIADSPLFEYLNNNDGGITEGVYDTKIAFGSEEQFLEALAEIDFEINDVVSAEILNNNYGWAPCIYECLEYVRNNNVKTISEENNKYVIAATIKAIKEIRQKLSDLDDAFYIEWKDSEEYAELGKNEVADDIDLQKLQAALSYKKTGEKYEMKDKFSGGAKDGYKVLKEIEDLCTIDKKLEAAGMNSVNVGDSEETKLNYTKEQFAMYEAKFNRNSYIIEGADENLKFLEELVKDKDYNSEYIVEESYKTKGELLVEGTDVEIYEQPNRETSAGSTSISIDDAITGGDDFINTGSDEAIKVSGLQTMSNQLHNVLVTIGVVVAIIVGLIIGIKFMVGSVEEKAEVKSLLVPYVVGCVVVFGGLAIWSVLVDILSQI